MAPTRLAAAAAFFVRQAKGSDTGLLAAGAVGWVGLAMTANPTFMQYCVGANSAAARVGAYFDLAAQTGYALETAVHWALMVCAMMLPLLVEPLRYVAFRSLRRTRRMNVASFLIGYLSVWSATIIALLTAEIVIRSSGLVLPRPGAWLGLAALLWQLSPHRRSILNRCHYQPVLRATALDAVGDTWRFGFRQAVLCVSACAPAMLAAMNSPVPLSASFIIGVLLFIERGRIRASPAPMAIATGLVGLVSSVA